MKRLRFQDIEGHDASVLGFTGCENWTIKLLSDNSILNELGPGGYTPAEHIHDHNIERGVVLSGQGMIIHGKDRVEIRPNDFFEIVEGNHQYVNTGNEGLVFLCFRFPR
jgi:mannose-6-phosphate isomerase-like protein (cupin superfamily)